MTAKEWFDRYPKVVQQGLKLGVIPVGVYTKYIHYLTFLEFNKSNLRTRAMDLTADLAKCGRTTIWESVTFFEETEISETSDFHFNVEDSPL